MKDRIKAIRNSKKLSQEAFAKDLGVSIANIKSYESDRRNPSDAFILLLCSKYKVNEEWLRTGEGEMFAPLSREAEIAEMTAQMFKDGDNSLKFQLQKVIAGMTEEEISLLRDIAKRWLDQEENLPK